MVKVKLGPETLLYPMPAVLVGARVDKKPNFMTAAWCGIAAFNPPAVSVAIRKERYTFKGIEKEGSFSINIPSVALAQKTDFCGIYSGRKKDKSELFDVFYGDLKTAPLVQDCPVNLECKVIHSLDLGSHVLFIGEIMETYVNEDCLTEKKPDPVKIDPLTYTPGNQEYRRLGRVMGKAFHMGKILKP